MEVGTLELKSSQRKDPFVSLSLFLHLSLDLPFHHLLIHFEQCDQIWQNLKVFGQFWYGLFCIWQAIIHTATIFYATGQIFIVINGQRLKNNLAIWSH